MNFSSSISGVQASKRLSALTLEFPPGVQSCQCRAVTWLELLTARPILAIHHTLASFTSNLDLNFASIVSYRYTRDKDEAI
ncbi:hypothetical protein Pdw03_3859 [Penicillium digitatum]|uniref:Uncharacterized protein n=1 Tax=Penicillium digitatum TaxID=36651 RepID=A0A7T6XH17_PENDI|nr:hypothetical protein Pdw03_3859 [Penicillium digitatum]